MHRAVQSPPLVLNVSSLEAHPLPLERSRPPSPLPQPLAATVHFLSVDLPVQPSRSMCQHPPPPPPFRAEPSIFWMGHNLCAHLSTDGHLGYFRRLAVASEVAMHVREQACVRCPSRFLGVFGDPALSVPRRFQTSPRSPCPCDLIGRFRFPQILTNAAAFLFLNTPRGTR